MAADTSAFLGDIPRASQLYELLGPYTDRLALLEVRLCLVEVPEERCEEAERADELHAQLLATARKLGMELPDDEHRPVPLQLARQEPTMLPRPSSRPSTALLATRARTWNRATWVTARP